MKTKKQIAEILCCQNAAFSRVELLISIVAVVTLLMVISPGLADTRSRSQRAGCVDNLRQIGQATQLWAADHGNENSWLVPVAQGGTKRAAKPGNAWFEFGWLSNQLVTPKILACPADTLRYLNSADNWSPASSGGYLNSARRGNNATSYIISLHSFFSDPNSLLSADRNLRVGANGSLGCGLSGVNNASGIYLTGVSANTAWTNGLHQLAGNLLLNDGRVLETSNSGLTEYLHSVTPQDDNVGPLHVLFP